MADINVLYECKNTYKDLPEQGSDAWLKQRESIVGGSEIKQLLSNPKILARSKAGVSKKFEGNIYTRHGNMYENVVKQIIEELTSKTVFEFGLIRKFDGLGCSPDMLMALTTNDIECLNFLLSVYGRPHLPYDEALVAGEVKCPTKRAIATTDVPEVYKHQVWNAISTFPFCKYGLFIDAHFVQDIPGRINGFIEFPEAPEIVTSDNLDRAFFRCLKYKEKFKLSPKIYFSDELHELERDIAGKNAVKWALWDFNIIKVMPNEAEMDKVRTKAKEFMQNMSKVRNSNDPETAIDLFF